MERSVEDKSPRTTVALRNTTKKRLDKNRFPGQSYDGFIRQLIDHWERKQARIPY